MTGDSLGVTQLKGLADVPFWGSSWNCNNVFLILHRGNTDLNDAKQRAERSLLLQVKSVKVAQLNF